MCFWNECFLILSTESLMCLNSPYRYKSFLLLEFCYLRRERKSVPWHTSVPWKSVPWHTFPCIKVLHYFLKKHCWITPNKLIYHKSLFPLHKIRRRYSQTNQVFDGESTKYGEFALGFSENRCFLLYTTRFIWYVAFINVNVIHLPMR